MNKYRAIPTTIDGIRFASKKEAKRYSELRLLLKAEQIEDLVLQPAYALTVKGVTVGRYLADFRYTDSRTGAVVVEDVKGMKTPVYRLKKKLVAAIHGVDISEV